MPAQIPDSQDTTPSNGRGRPLTSALLSAAPLAKLDKSRVLKTYISSQRTYKNHFVQEGHKDWISFNKAEDHNATERDENVDEQACETLDAGFSTPKLKARVPEPPKKAVKKALQPELSSERMSSESLVEHARKGQRKEKDPLRAHRLNITEACTSTKNRQEESARKRQRSVESEREAILADRRERRRAKKAIVDPKKADTDAEDEQTAKGRKKTSKKDKKTSLAAGLALMHGFSAENLGSKRITMKPSFGVFQKGKASAKTKSSKVKGKNNTSRAWSEQDFLGKAADTRATRPSKRRSRSISDDRSESSSSSRSSGPKPPTKKFKISNYECRDKSSKTESNIAKSTQGREDEYRRSEGSEVVQEDASPEIAAEEGLRSQDKAGSIVWEIERGLDIDEVQEPDAISKVTSSYGPQNTVIGTLVLDTSTRWQVGMPQPDDFDFARPLNEEEASKISFASLCPSQSASQIGRRKALDLHVSNPRPLRSKYFKGSSPQRADMERPSSPRTEDAPFVEQRNESPPPLTRFSDNNWARLDPKPDSREVGYPAPTASSAKSSHEEYGIDEEDPARPTDPASRQQIPPGIGSFARFVPASTLPRHPLSDDSLTGLDELLDDSLDRYDLSPAALQGRCNPLLEAREPDDDEMYDQLFDRSSYCHGDVPEYSEGPVSETMDDVDQEGGYLAQHYIQPEERLDHVAGTYWTDEDAEKGPPLYIGADASMDLPPSSEDAYSQDPFDDDRSDEDIEMSANITWDPDAGVDIVDGAMYDATEDVYADPQEVPQSPSQGKTYVESTETSSLDDTPKNGEFCEGLALLRQSMENRWTGAAQEETGRYPTVSKVEEDVAKGLQNHWLPQRL